MTKIYMNNVGGRMCSRAMFRQHTETPALKQEAPEPKQKTPPEKTGGEKPEPKTPSTQPQGKKTRILDRAECHTLERLSKRFR